MTSTGSATVMNMTMSVGFNGASWYLSHFHVCKSTPTGICINCTDHYPRFEFSPVQFEKVFTWSITDSRTLNKRQDNPKATIKLNFTGDLTRSFRPASAFHGLPTTGMADFIYKTYVEVIPDWSIGIYPTTMETKMRDIYNEWLEECVYPKLSESVTYDGM